MVVNFTINNKPLKHISTISTMIKLPDSDDAEAITNGFLSGLRRIVNQQQKDGSWPHDAHLSYPSTQATGHVVFALLEILGAESEVVGKALSWMEANFVTPAGASHGFWVDQIMRGKPDVASCLLCSYALLYARRMGRHFERLSFDRLIECAREAVNTCLHESRAVYWQPGPWVLFMTSKLLSLGYLDETIKNRWRENVIETLENQLIIEKNDFDVAAHAQGFLGLLENGNAPENLLHSQINRLLSAWTIHDDGTMTWSNDISGENRFEFIRWILLALEAAIPKTSRDNSCIMEIHLRAGVEWIVKNQGAAGEWQRREGETFGPSFSAYAVLAIWDRVRSQPDMVSNLFRKLLLSPFEQQDNRKASPSLNEQTAGSDRLWDSELTELGNLYQQLQRKSDQLEMEVARIRRTADSVFVMLSARRLLELIVSPIFEKAMKKAGKNERRGTQPLGNVIEKLKKTNVIEDHICTSMENLNRLSTYGAHPKEFSPRQVKEALMALCTVVDWYIKESQQ